MANGFGSPHQPQHSKNKFLSLAGQELFRLDSPSVDPELETEARRFFEITEELHKQFNQACEILLAAYVAQSGAGQLATALVDKERKAWVIPIAATEETERKVAQLRESDRFGELVRLYHHACPLPPHQAMVVQTLKDGKFETVYRLRDDVKMGL